MFPSTLVISILLQLGYFTVAGRTWHENRERGVFHILGRTSLDWKTVCMLVCSCKSYKEFNFLNAQSLSRYSCSMEANSRCITAHVANVCRVSAEVFVKFLEDGRLFADVDALLGGYSFVVQYDDFAVYRFTLRLPTLTGKSDIPHVGFMVEYTICGNSTRHSFSIDYMPWSAEMWVNAIENQLFNVMRT
jgi:hypothetical protein